MDQIPVLLRTLRVLGFFDGLREHLSRCRCIFLAKVVKLGVGDAELRSLLQVIVVGLEHPPWLT